MSRVKQKITCTKNKEVLNQIEWRQLANANNKMTQILEVADKDFKAAIIKMLLSGNYEHIWNK